MKPWSAIFVLLLLASEMNALTVRASLSSWEPYECEPRSLWHAARTAYAHGRQEDVSNCKNEVRHVFGLVGIRSLLPSEAVFEIRDPTEFADRTPLNEYFALCRLVSPNDSERDRRECSTHTRALRMRTWAALTRFVLREFDSLPRSTFKKVIVVESATSRPLPKHELSEADRALIVRYFPHYSTRPIK